MGKYIDYLDIQEEVRQRLRSIVELWHWSQPSYPMACRNPQNVEMAKNCERIIRKAGAVPATIAS